MAVQRIAARRRSTRRELLNLITKEHDSVGVSSSAYDRMWVRWELIEDLFEGRDRMIEKGRLWLPQEPLESIESYECRLTRSFLFGAYPDTVESLSSRPFSRDVTCDANLLPESLRSMVEDVDMEGRNLTTFAKESFREGLKRGHGLIFVEFPQIQQPITLRQQIEAKIRPYFVHVSPRDLLGWRRRQTLTGRKVLSQIRFREFRTEDRGAYGDEEVEHVRVISAPAVLPEEVGFHRTAFGEPPTEEQTTGTWELWRRVEPRRTIREDELGRETLQVSRKEYAFVRAGPHTYPGIPLEPWYARQVGYLESRPPFEELAEQNLEWWQKNSDRSNILRFVSIATLALTGWRSEDFFDQHGRPVLPIGANKYLITSAADAKATYVEHSGAGLESLSKTIDEIQDRMMMLGLAPLIERQQDVTALAQEKGDRKVGSQLQAWIRNLELALTRSFQHAATWMNVQDQVDEDFSVDVFNEFALKVGGDSGDVEILMKAFQIDAIDQETFLWALKKRGVLTDSDDPEEIMRRVREDSVAFERELVRREDLAGVDPDAEGGGGGGDVGSEDPSDEGAGGAAA